MGTLGRGLLAAALLLAASFARADNDEYFTIATMGDLQFHVECNMPDTAIDAFTGTATSMIDWIIDRADEIDLVISAGDLTYEYYRMSPAWTDTCDCLASSPAPCNQYTNSYGDTCTQCADTQAIACKGGTPGAYCEQTRVWNAFKRLVDARIPVIWASGNHDFDPPGNPDDRWAHYNQYLHASRMPKHLFKEMGVFTDEIMGTYSYHVLEAAGIDWLFLGYGYTFPTKDTWVEVNRWFFEVMQDHDRMPTFLVAHILVNTGGWSTEPGAVSMHLLDSDPQLGFKIGGHYGSTLADPIKTNDYYHVLTGGAGENIFGYVHDYSYDGRVGGGLPAWVLQVNGGGGVVGMIRIHPRSGSISHYSYSPRQGERVEITGGDGQTVPQWSTSFPICGENKRWDIPESACTRPVETRHVPHRGHIETQNPADLY